MSTTVEEFEIRLNALEKIKQGKPGSQGPFGQRGDLGPQGPIGERGPEGQPVWGFIRGKTAKRTLTMNSDGITTKIGRVGNRHPWKKVQQVTDTPQFVLIALTNGNAFFIPIRAFSSPEHREKFLTETRSWSGATSQAASTPE